MINKVIHDVVFFRLVGAVMGTPADVVKVMDPYLQVPPEII